MLRRYVARTVRLRATQRGLLGGHRGWLAVFALLQVAKFSQRLTKRGAGPVVFAEALRAGERFEIVHLPAPPSRRQRRRARKKARRLERRSR
jgi:hypothetical protein